MSCNRSPLAADLEEKLKRFALALIDQKSARPIVSPMQPAAGFWFGGGNLVADENGILYLVGRYRDAGDSRTGLAAGKRGWELAIFQSQDRGQTFDKLVSLDKNDLTYDDRAVLSIEGTALHWTDDGVELFVSTEKAGVGYPDGFEDHLKPGTGVWSIDRLHAPSVPELNSAPREPILASTDPGTLHVKDPFLYDCRDGSTMLLFCSHPFCWTSSNTGYAIRRPKAARFDEPVFDFFSRGFTWDVAMTRGTCVLDVPRMGAFSDCDVTLLFYDGGECVRQLDEHKAGVHRPRGYSCEELGGVAILRDGKFDGIERLSRNFPMFVSPHGTGCSRYVDVLETDDGYYATWQQSQADGSQPLVMNFLPRADALALFV